MATHTSICTAPVSPNHQPVEMRSSSLPPGSPFHEPVEEPGQAEHLAAHRHHPAIARDPHHGHRGQTAAQSQAHNGSAHLHRAVQGLQGQQYKGDNGSTGWQGKAAAQGQAHDGSAHLGRVHRGRYKG